MPQIPLCNLRICFRQFFLTHRHSAGFPVFIESGQHTLFINHRFQRKRCLRAVPSGKSFIQPVSLKIMKGTIAAYKVSLFGENHPRFTLHTNIGSDTAVLLTKHTTASLPVEFVLSKQSPFIICQPVLKAIILGIQIEFRYRPLCLRPLCNLALIVYPPVFRPPWILCQKEFRYQ